MLIDSRSTFRYDPKLRDCLGGGTDFLMAAQHEYNKRGDAAAGSRLLHPGPLGRQRRRAWARHVGQYTF